MAAFDGVTLKMFHGGNFQSVGNKLVYCGRQCKTFRIDPDELSWWDLEERAKECGNYTHIESIHYLLPGLGFDKGLRRVYNDDEVREMGDLILKVRCLELFVVEGKAQSMPTSNSNSVPKQQERPAKLTPKKASNLPLRKSPRASSKSAVVEPLEPISQPNITKRPTKKPTTESNSTFNPTNDTSVLPEVIFLGTQTSTTDKNLLLTFPTSTTTQNITSPKQKQTNLNTIITTTSVPENYEWEDPRPDSPIPIHTLVGNHSDDGDDDDDSDTEYQPLSESSEGEVVGSEGEETGGEDDTLFDAEDDLDEEERALDTARKDELEGDNGDTSDEEFFTARERVKGCNAKLLEIASQLQKDANEGRLGSQVRGEASNAARSEQLEGCVSDYEQSDEEVHTPPDSGEDETLHERRSKRSLLVSLESDFKLFSWKVGQRFATRSDFKKAVAKYGIYQGRNVSIKISNKSRQQRVGVRCLNGCPFQLYASWDSRRSSFVVKTVREEHTCTRNMKKNKQLKYKWVAEQLLDVFKARPHWPGKEIVKTVRRGFKIVISVDFAYKVKKAAHKMLHGSMKDHYAKLRRYIEAIIKCSPGTHISLVSTMEHDTPPQIFQRLFVSFEGLQKGWKEGCRKIICVDACFLKTFLGGQLLSAVGRDGNDQMYPIAWAVVEGENNLSWEWFFNQLQSCLGLGEGNELVILSDEHRV
ncbi:Palmitoyltransferase ZDHHC2 [Bienertia sinuspersici]